MKQNWATWSINHKQIIYFFIFLLILMGTYSYNTLGRSEDPPFPIKTMIVTAAWPGATAEEVQEHVTKVIEKQLQTSPGVDNISSYSRPGVSLLKLTLKEDYPNDKVRQTWLRVRNIVNDNKDLLPSGIYGPYYNDRFDDVYGNIYAVTGNEYSYEELRKIADKVKDKIYQVDSTQTVKLLGVQEQKIYLEVSNEKLSRLQIPLTTIANAVSSETAMTASSKIDSSGNNVYLRLTGSPSTLTNIKNIPIKSNGRTFKLGDIANVTRGYVDPSDPQMYFNGEKAVGIAISMQEGANNIEFGENLTNKIAEIQKDLPLGVTINQVANQPKVVQNAINEFMESLIEAVIIVLIVSLFSMGRRCGYVISVCIPLVLLTTFTGMYFLNIGLHKVSLGSLIIALGMLVDDSIVVVELIEVKLSEGWDRTKAASYAFATCAKPLFIGTSIACVGFMPIAFSKGDVGIFAGTIFSVMTLALMSSWLISGTVAPVLAHNWVKPDLVAEGSTFKTPFYNTFRKVLRSALNHKAVVLVSILVVFIGSIFLFQTLRQEFFPSSVRPEILLELNMPEGTSIESTSKAAMKITNKIKDDENVLNVSTYVGESSPRFVLVLNPVMPRDNYAQLVVVAKDISSRNALEKKLNLLVTKYVPEATGYSYPVPLGPPSDYPVMFRVSANTNDQVREYAQKVRNFLLKDDRYSMVRFDWMNNSGAIELNIDVDKLAQMGLSREIIAQTLQAELSGYTIAEYLEGDQKIDLVFRLDKDIQKNISNLQNISISTANGPVPLNQIATLKYKSESNMIWTRNLKPTVTIGAAIIPGESGDTLEEESYQALTEFRKNLPSGVTIERAGALEKSIKSMDYILDTVPLMIVIMLILLMIQLQDFKRLLVVLLTAPLGIIGVTLGLYLFHLPVSILAKVAILALTGIIIRNSIVLLDQIELHKAQGLSDWSAVLESAIVRFRPIMLAAFTTVLGLIPMFPSVFWQSMVVALASGLTIATFLTLIIVPVFYATIFGIKENK
jgi:multidrug efflux pump